MDMSTYMHDRNYLALPMHVNFPTLVPYKVVLKQVNCLLFTTKANKQTSFPYVQELSCHNPKVMAKYF